MIEQTKMISNRDNNNVNRYSKYKVGNSSFMKTFYRKILAVWWNYTTKMVVYKLEYGEYNQPSVQCVVNEKQIDEMVAFILGERNWRWWLWKKQSNFLENNM